MILETIVVGPLQVNCYVLACAAEKEAIIIDPGAQERKIKVVLGKYKLTPKIVINTHGHYDHIGCNDNFKVPILAHRLDIPMLQDAALNLSADFSLSYRVESKIKSLEDKALIKLDCLELEVIHLPGHTPGGIGLLMHQPQNDIIFTGDTLFCQGVGRWDLPGGSREELERSIRERLFVLPLETKVYPGHGPMTTIGQELKHDLF